RCRVPRFSQLMTTERSVVSASSTSVASRPEVRARTASRAPRGSCAWTASRWPVTPATVRAGAPDSSCARRRCAASGDGAGRPVVGTGLILAPGRDGGARPAPLQLEQLQLLHVGLLHAQDRLRAAEEHEPAVLVLHAGDVLVRLPHDLLIVSVDHPVGSHRRYS